MTTNRFSGSDAKQVSEPSNTRLTLGDYFADVLLDTSRNIKIYHWVVQKVGSAVIIQWGQEYSFEDAKSGAQQYLEALLVRDGQKPA